MPSTLLLLANPCSLVLFDDILAVQLRHTDELMLQEV